jgi:flavodoxin
MPEINETQNYPKTTPNYTEIYYFSGTGNSLHIVKELQKRIPETKLTPILRLVNKESIKTTTETEVSSFRNTPQWPQKSLKNSSRSST